MIALPTLSLLGGAAVDVVDDVLDPDPSVQQIFLHCGKDSLAQATESLQVSPPTTCRQRMNHAHVWVPTGPMDVRALATLRCSHLSESGRQVEHNDLPSSPEVVEVSRVVVVAAPMPMLLVILLLLLPLLSLCSVPVCDELLLFIEMRRRGRASGGGRWM
jgi:hypothetical protein